jgi:hypothetical protein
LTASDGAAKDRLGTSVAIDGDTILAGAPLDDVGANADQGSVYTFSRTGAAARTETAKVTASDGAAGDNLGFSVAIDGDVAGAPLDDSGANAEQGSAYTFARAGAAARTETAKLTASDAAAGDQLGLTVAIDGDTIVTGAPLDNIAANPDQGSAYTFARTGAAARTETAKLTAGDGAANDRLGFSAAIDGDAIVVGAAFDTVGANTDQGSAYTFARTGAAARTDTAKLTATDGGAFDELGISVAVDGDTVVAGAPVHKVGMNTQQGSAYTFARAGAAVRTETGQLTAGDGAAFDQFGTAVAIDGSTTVVGAQFADVGTNVDTGSASVFFAPDPSPTTPTTTPPGSGGSPVLASGTATPGTGGGTGTGTAGGGASSARPVLSKLKVSPTTFRRGSSAPKGSKSRAPGKITFTLSEAAKVKFSLAKAKPAKACARPNRSNHGNQHCTRYATVGSSTAQGQSGPNTVPFPGTLSHRKRLSAGSYKLTATPTDSTGNTGQARTVTLRVLAQ